MQTTFKFLKHDFSPEQGIATFFYQLQTPEKTYDFVETLQFPKAELLNTKYQILNTILNNLLLILGISYWKTTCGNIELPGDIILDKQQAEFWNTVYTKGLGEFFYKNKIDYRGLVSFPYTDNPVIQEKKGESLLRHPRPDRGSIQKDSRLRGNDGVDEGDDNHSKNETMQQFNNKTRSLLFFGGGKDSIVSAELLKKANKPFTLFMVNSSQVQEQTAGIVGAETLVVTRTIDQKLIELNKQAVIYNGHIPISAVWAFVGVFAAFLYNYEYLITSNEQSANYGNVEYLGEEINHQWSKSEEFQKMFQAYIQKNITQDIVYFSLLRPLHEIKIAQLFSAHKHYFPYFSSCNRNFTLNKTVEGVTGAGDPRRAPGALAKPSDGGGSRQDPYMVVAGPQNDNKQHWCGKCPKCLFVFIALSAFLPKQTLLEIFGRNLYEDASLLPLLKQLTGKENFKPFECVGTPQETLLALRIASQANEYTNNVLMEYAQKELATELEKSDTNKTALLGIGNKETLPSDFINVL